VRDRRNSWVAAGRRPWRRRLGRVARTRRDPEGRQLILASYGSCTLLAYDPAIAVPFREAPAPANLWPLWDAIRCPTLLLRGAQSDLLSAATAAEMRARGPQCDLVEFAGI
jgi:pimeloyl-ACP methyl ester carboxylesterase